MRFVQIFTEEDNTFDLDIAQDDTSAEEKDTEQPTVEPRQSLAVTTPGTVNSFNELKQAFNNDQWNAIARTILKPQYPNSNFALRGAARRYLELLGPGGIYDFLPHRYGATASTNFGYTGLGSERTWQGIYNHYVEVLKQANDEDLEASLDWTELAERIEKSFSIIESDIHEIIRVLGYVERPEDWEALKAAYKAKTAKDLEPELNRKLDYTQLLQVKDALKRSGVVFAVTRERPNQDKPEVRSLVTDVDDDSPIEDLDALKAYMEKLFRQLMTQYPDFHEYLTRSTTDESQLPAEYYMERFSTNMKQSLNTGGVTKRSIDREFQVVIDLMYRRFKS